MCTAAAFVINREYKVFVHPAEDSHNSIIAYNKLYEGDIFRGLNIAECEVVPPNKDLSKPYKDWMFRARKHDLPDWFNRSLAEGACRAALPLWGAKLESVDIDLAFNMPIPLTGVERVYSSSASDLKEWGMLNSLAKNYASKNSVNPVRQVVFDSVVGKVGVSAATMMYDSILSKVMRAWPTLRKELHSIVRRKYGNKIHPYRSDWSTPELIAEDGEWNGMRNSALRSMEAVAAAYLGSLFHDIKDWKGMAAAGEDPWGCVSRMITNGCIPSFDGYIWRVHAGKEAKVTNSLLEPGFWKTNPDDRILKDLHAFKDTPKEAVNTGYTLKGWVAV